MEPSEQEKPQIQARATVIDTGAIPLPLSNIPLGIPDKPDIMASHHGNSSAAMWSLSEIFSQQKLIGTYNISTSTAVDKPVWSFQHTFQNVLDLHFRELQGLFSMYSWTLHFRFQFRSNFQQVGQVLIVNHTIPQRLLPFLIGTKPLKTLEENYMLMTTLPHVKVPMGEDIDVDCSLKWNVPVQAPTFTKEHYTLPSGDVPLPDTLTLQYDMGSVFVIAPIQMEVAQNVTPNMTVRIWSWLTDVKMGGYSPADAII
jgi:hypothetical protein